MKKERAFPYHYGVSNEGMTLRDYFAGLALIGLTGTAISTKHGDNAYGYAKYSYEIADAMLAERKEK